MRNMRTLSAGTAIAPVPILLLLVLGIADRHQGATPDPACAPQVVAAPGSPSADWWSAASRVIEAREYEASPSAQGLQAPNRANGIRTYFREGGIEVVPRRSGSSWTWTWSTRFFGREDALLPVAAATPSPDHASIRYNREEFLEWYENGPSGLEQGFAIASPPPGRGEVCIAGTFRDGLSPVTADEGATIHFVDCSGTAILRYGKLAAFDAAGKQLPSRFALAGRNMRILVDDRGASYPIQIDPLLDTPSWQHDGDQTSLAFGRAISTAGDVNGDGYSDIIVGASGYDGADTLEGRVWAFYGSADGLPTDPDWIDTGDLARSGLGVLVSTAGDVNGDGYHDIIVTATRRPNEDGTEGRVYVYYGSPRGLTTAGWYVNGGMPDNSLFGIGIASAGDVNGDGFDDVLIGAYRQTGALYRQGRAWLYLGSASGLSTTPAWITDGEQEDSYYGCHMAGLGDVNADGYDDFMVSAECHDTIDADAGRAYLFLGSPTGVSTTPAWIEDGVGGGARFGYEVGRAGDVDGDGYADALISVLYTDPEPLEGRVFLYKGCATGLESDPAWWDDGDNDGAYFGYSAQTAGDVNGDGLSDVLIGAPYYAPETGVILGRAFLYYGSRAGLPAEPSWYVEGDQTECDLGLPVATAGDVNGDGFSDFLVSARRYDAAYTNGGRVYLYLGSGNGPKESAGWVIESNQAGAYFGFSVANAGDINGDGYDEIIVGAPGYDNGQTNEGAAFLFLGHGAGPSLLPDWWAESNQPNASFGLSAACAGDVNGDGYDDVIIGSPDYDVTFSNEGKAFLWFGTPGGAPMGTPANAAWSCAGGSINAGAGYSVACAGDVDSDGFADVIVGIPGYSNGQNMEGKVAVYEGSATGPSGAASWSFESDQANALAGFSVAGAGDTNADGFSDVIVGAPYYELGFIDEGIAWLYRGSSGGVTSPHSWLWKGNQDNAHFGWSVARAGDANGDGYSDLVVGIPDARYGLPEDPAILVAYGTGSGPLSMTTILNSNGRYGYCVAPAGDVDGDGYSDIIVGVPNSTNPDTGDPNCGDVRFLRGTPDGVEWTAVRIYGNQTGALFGSSVASADVNGDGFSDILVGAQAHSQGQEDEGRSFVYYGNDSRGLARAPDQLRSDLSAPIGLRGNAGSTHAFALRALGRTAGGRGKVRMEWQVEPMGQPLEGARVEVGSRHDTGVPTANLGSAVQLTEVFGSLVPASGQHWRLRIATHNPYFPRTPWFSPSGNAPTELDFRTGGSPLVVDEPVGGPNGLSILCMPNPVVSSASIRFSISEAGPVSVAVHDIQGRLVRTLLRKALEPGSQTIRWDGTDEAGRRLASGVYWIRLRSAAGEEHQKIVVSD